MKPPGRRLAILTGLLALAVVTIATWVAWPHLRFWYLFESLGVNAQGYPEYKHRQTGIVMVSLPGGKFSMGAQKTDPNGRNYDPDAQDDEGPVHEVTLSPFMIGKYEVTQAQGKAVMGSNQSVFVGDDLPAEFVSWDDIQQFEAKTGLTLPTEAEWEYACRAGTSTPISGTGKLDDMGWFSGNTGGYTTHPVGKKAPNGFGIHDMIGNVCEWCKDRYSGYDRSMAVNRGGSWNSKASFCRCSTRMMDYSDFQDTNLGFRASAPAP